MPVIASGAADRPALAEAISLILGCERFGNVYSDLTTETDRRDLKEWFVREPTVPVETPRNMDLRKTPPVPFVTPTGDPTGDPCVQCGALMVQTGKCKTCQFCGTGEGSCS